jgi:formate hydrogenlyase subunit 3/multisubunit Na+/H+ antiporter MnhD subunit
VTAILAVPSNDEPITVRGNAIGSVLSGAATTGIGAAGIGVGLTGVFGSLPPIRIGWLLPLIGVQLDIEPLGGFFIALTGAVAVAVGVYAIGYARREHWGAVVMTQLGFAAILLALMVLAASGGADRFADLAGVSDGTRTVVFVLTLAGFGSKAGLVPLHAWLPRAHPEAPSPVSALMSAAMVNLGVYGIIRVDLQVLGPGPRWWGVTLLVVGGVSAVYGVLQATVATDLKRLLAYSTTENMGLIALGLGAATLLSTSGAKAAAAVAMAAAMLHLIAHAAFKSLGFLAAGSVLAATGLRDLDRLGGLARRMPTTTTLFGIAALGASGLPLGAGFVGEWLLVQSLIHARPDHHTVVALATPLAVGAVALTTGLGVAAMVKAFGIGFLARPRSTAAAEAREAPTSMITGMAIAAIGCIVLAVAPFIVAPVLQHVLERLPASRGAEIGGLGMVLRLPGIDASMAPGLIGAALVAAVLIAARLARWGSRRRPAAVRLPLWACGADELTARMQYTATSFAQPLQRVFDDVLAPDTDIEVTHVEESHYLAEKIAYRVRLADAIEVRLYAPVLRLVARCAQVIRRAHTGSVHLYLGYGALGVLIVLVVAR